MPWDMNKCLWGVPSGFTNVDAQTAVENAKYELSVYVNISAQDQNTKQAYTYYVFGGFRLCVVAHVHKDTNGEFTIAGNCFIPGWQDWELETPENVIQTVGALPIKGSFPGDARYPHAV
ncbi:MAG: hypothetical protein WCC64_13220 [Aliidongia sp.]